MIKFVYLIFMLPTLVWAQISIGPSVVLPSSGPLTVVGTGGTNSISGGNTLKIVTTAAGNATVNLPTAVGRAGQKITIKKDTAANYNYAAITPNGSETIDGSTAAYRLYTPNECITLISDGANWRTEEHLTDYSNLNEAWTDSQSNATTNVNWQRRGNTIKIVGKVSFTGAAGTGMTITIPTEFNAASTVYDFSSASVPVGTATLRDTGTDTFQGVVLLTAAGTLTIYALNQGGGTTVNWATITATVPFTWANGDQIFIDAEWVVTNWRN